MIKQWITLLFVISGVSSSLAAEVVGVGNFSHIVADLDRSIVFYGVVLELEPNVAMTPFSGNPAIMQLGNTPGAQSRIATFRIPGSELGVELIEYKDISRQPIQTRFQDPGATLVQLQVRDIDGILERLENSGGFIWTPSGEPINLGATARIIFLKDPDGFFVELIENEASNDVSIMSNVYGGNFELIIGDTDENAAFYRDGLGFDPRVSDGFDNTELLTNTVSALGGAFRRTTLTITGTEVSMAFLEFSDIDRKPMQSRIQDPGTAIMQIFVDDVAEMTAQLEAAGGTIITQGGRPVIMPDGRQISIVRDPNNLFIELLPQPD